MGGQAATNCTWSLQSSSVSRRPNIYLRLWADVLPVSGHATQGQHWLSWLSWASQSPATWRCLPSALFCHIACSWQYSGLPWLRNVCQYLRGFANHWISLFYNFLIVFSSSDTAFYVDSCNKASLFMLWLLLWYIYKQIFSVHVTNYFGFIQWLNCRIGWIWQYLILPSDYGLLLFSLSFVIVFGIFLAVCWNLHWCY